MRHRRSISTLPPCLRLSLGSSHLLPNKHDSCFSANAHSRRVFSASRSSAIHERFFFSSQLRLAMSCVLVGKVTPCCVPSSRRITPTIRSATGLPAQYYHVCQLDETSVTLPLPCMIVRSFLETNALGTHFFSFILAMHVHS